VTTGFHEGPRSFAIGLENTRLLCAAFKGVAHGDLASAGKRLRDVFDAELKPLDAACQKLGLEHCWQVRCCLSFSLSMSSDMQSWLWSPIAPGARRLDNDPEWLASW